MDFWFSLSFQPLQGCCLEKGHSGGLVNVNYLSTQSPTSPSFHAPVKLAQVRQKLNTHKSYSSPFIWSSEFQIWCSFLRQSVRTLDGDCCSLVGCGAPSQLLSALPHSLVNKMNEVCSKGKVSTKVLISFLFSCPQLGYISCSLSDLRAAAGCRWNIQDLYPCSFSSPGCYWYHCRSEYRIITRLIYLQQCRLPMM